MVTVRGVEYEDSGSWLEMRLALWPEGSEAEHREEIRQFFEGEFPRGPWIVFLAVDPSGRVLGFSELSVRSYAEGCRSSRVAYLEGWFVWPEFRGRGVGRALILAGSGGAGPGVVRNSHRMQTPITTPVRRHILRSILRRWAWCGAFAKTCEAVGRFGQPRSSLDRGGRTLPDRVIRKGGLC